MGLEAARELDCAALGALLREPREAERTLVLDCRPFLAFCRRHVRAARPVPWNALLRRRARGPPAAALACLLPDRALRARLARGELARAVVLDEGSASVADLPPDGPAHALLAALLHETRAGPAAVCFLPGGFDRFQACCPDLCSESPAPAMTPDNDDHDRSDSRAPSYDQGGPVEILPYLYLGSCSHSSDLQGLRACGITAVLNVSASCPNHFEGLLSYKSIPVEDSQMVEISAWFPEAIGFIGFILGAPSASHCAGACGTRFSEDLTPEETQTSWDKDIPAINQGLIPEESPESSFLLEGDILRPSPFRLFSAASSKWPKNGGVVEVPFLLSGKYDKPSRQVILEAFAEFERSTCIRCFSSIGRSGGMQVVSLGPSCLQRGPGIVLHELMHVLGFWHEHSRADRDRYIRVNWNEILPGFEMNFIKSRSSNMLVPYDYSSVMHYGRLAFSRRGLPTITPLWAPSVHIGQRWNLSNSDIERVLRFYGCGPSGHEPSGKGLQAPGSGRSPTPGSRSQLQQLLKALVEESRRSDPGGFGAEDQHGAAAARSEASLRAQKPPAMRNSDVKASADPTPSAPSFLLEANAWGGLP